MQKINKFLFEASFEYCNVEFTFGQTNQMAEKLASGLIAIGLKEGDNVAILGPNMPEWFLLVKLTTKPLELFYLKEVLNLVSLEMGMRKSWFPACQHQSSVHCI